jgi:hypothetical protein
MAIMLATQCHKPTKLGDGKQSQTHMVMMVDGSQDTKKVTLSLGTTADLGAASKAPWRKRPSKAKCRPTLRQRRGWRGGIGEVTIFLLVKPNARSHPQNHHVDINHSPNGRCMAFFMFESGFFEQKRGSCLRKKQNIYCSRTLMDISMSGTSGFWPKILES